MMQMQRSGLLEQYHTQVIQASPAERAYGHIKLTEPACLYLNSSDPRQRLSEIIIQVLSVNVNTNMSFDPSKAQGVFNFFENYALNLLDYPWKREFRKITMYSGFYKTSIEPVLKDAWKLFSLIGYEKDGMCLEMKKLPDSKKLCSMALEFFLASIECTIYIEVWKKLSCARVTMRDVHEHRMKISGDSDVLVKALARFDAEKAVDSFGKDDKCDLIMKAPLPLPVDLQEMLNNKMSAKPVKYEGSNQFGVPTGAKQVDLTHANVAPISDMQHTNNGCDQRTESIEAMLQQVTPEMISDAKFRKNFITKLTEKKIGTNITQPSDGLSHSSLPAYQEPNVTVVRPHTEPLVLPNLPRNQKQADKNYQPHTEPLAIAKPRISSKSTSKIDDSKPTWQCQYCSYMNISTHNNNFCKMCQKVRRGE